MSYQREYGLAADGICGPETLRSLYFLSSRVSGGSPHAIREEELVRSSGPKLSGKRIIIDPGRGGVDHGLIAQGPAGPISEADLLWDLASRLEGRMAAIGMETHLSRPTNRSPSDAERAATANAVGADLMISLRCETQTSLAANGVASFTSATRTARCLPSAAILPISFNEKWWRAPVYGIAVCMVERGICCG